MSDDTENSVDDSKSGSDTSEKSKESYADKESDGDKEGVDVSEDFQQQAHLLVNGCTKAECAHVRGKVMNREDELRKKEIKKSGDTPESFSSDGMDIN